MALKKKKEISKYIKSGIFGTALKVLKLPKQGTDGITNATCVQGQMGIMTVQVLAGVCGRVTHPGE